MNDVESCTDVAGTEGTVADTVAVDTGSTDDAVVAAAVADDGKLA